MRPVRALFQLSMVCLAGGGTYASSPSGVWSFPDSVTILDESTAQPLVVIEGLFTVWSGEGDVGADWGMKGYEDAAWGVMVYRCKADEKALCLMQWGEIKTAATDEACVGWGDQETAPGSVRDDDDTTSPDPYPIALGVVTGVTPCNYLATIPPRDPPAEPSPEPVAEAVVDTAPAEPSPEPGPEPTPEPTTEATTTTTSADTSTVNDAATGTDTAVGGEETEGGGCAGAGLGLLPMFVGLAGLVALGARRAGRRRG